ncbi:MAG TPA: ElyC/SanA/YdcF family protein [Spirochaetota bacterium]|nr:ElyC/SanA/YdcF family protein [Spirochaetota bacterium]HPJ35065.1 ElyC/SanA/YdcF family protein [Spirochaetota bacterium]
MSAIKKLPFLLFSAIIVFSAALMFVDGYISSYSSQYVTERMEELPFNKCGLLLGTSKYRVEGGINPFFAKRLDAAAYLYHSGRIRCVIASGDNSEKSYNEPRAMMQGLKDRGIPSDSIYLDFAGFRTLDSVVRAREIFGQNSITVISQKFHNERAVYIGRKRGIDVTGFNAHDWNDADGIPVRIREIFARFKAFIDVNLTGEQPKFLGEKIEID